MKNVREDDIASSTTIMPRTWGSRPVSPRRTWLSSFASMVASRASPPTVSTMPTAAATSESPRSTGNA